MNPSSGATGNKICGSPWTGNSQRGLAYDIVNNGFFIGGWNEGIVYHIDSSGNVIDSANVGLPISGLAYSPQNGHLLVMSNQTGNPDVTVLDANNNYAVLGTFYIGGSSPVMTPFGQAGMEFDCAGNLWVIDQNTQTIYMVDSGENVACSVDIPWLSENPTEGTLAAGTEDLRARSRSLSISRAGRSCRVSARLSSRSRRTLRSRCPRFRSPSRSGSSTCPTATSSRRTSTASPARA